MLKKEDLLQFTGTEQWHKYHLGILLTDGVKYLADKGAAWWLIDAIISYYPKQKDVPFQLWELKKTGSKAVLTMKEDSGKIALVTQAIPYTDFPLEKIKLYLIDKVILLPSEY